MPKDVLITPASGLIDFKDAAGSSDATIQLDDLGNLNITNPAGVLTIGNTAANTYIGDGINSVDIIFEQSGKIRALTGKTLTLGQSDSSISIVSPTSISTQLTSTVATGTAPLTVASTTTVTNLSADLLDGLHLNTSGRADVANQVVRTDANGYIQAGWINSTSGDNGTTAITRVYASNDAYIRYYSLANFGAQIAPYVPVSASAGGFWENNVTLSTSYSITANKNAMTAGPVTIANGVTITVPNGSTWTVV